MDRRRDVRLGSHLAVVGQCKRAATTADEGTEATAGEEVPYQKYQTGKRRGQGL